MTAIPNTPSSAYIIPGLKFRKALIITTDDILSFIRAVEQAFSLPPGAFTMRWPGSGRPKKNLNGIRLSELRQAVCLYLTSTRTIAMERIAPAVGMKDHTCVIYARNRGRQLLEIKDDRFLALYEQVRTVNHQ